MSAFFDYIAGNKDGPIAAAEARAEYSEGMMESLLDENEAYRAAIKKAVVMLDQGYSRESVSAFLLKIVTA